MNLNITSRVVCLRSFLNV